MKNISLFTTTFYNDFDLLSRLLKSIVKHVGTNYKHYIILNDDISHMAELNSILADYPVETIVMHIDDFDEFKKPEVENCNFGIRTLEGWVTQIMLTILAARKIDTEYYLHLCSKDYFIQTVDIQKIVKNNKILVPFENFAPFSEQFYEFFENACKIIDIDVDKVKQYLIAPQTPIMNSTKLMIQLLDYLDENNLNIIDIIGVNGEWCNSKNKTNEYYLFSAWMVKMRLENNFDWYPLTMNPYMKDASYDLRRPYTY